MLKSKLDFKLVNIALLALIVFLVYKTSPFWGKILENVVNITIPFLIAFAIAYALHPFLVKMINNKIPKWAGV
jgi:predicted PurR-regulated permease PerM